ncbi:MAG: hypothetical protein PHT59_04760 [Candidatus Omnitrophica bacterium]|nr:hypothetical protein [Candidatus Omnitrophota bacterium]
MQKVKTLFINPDLIERLYYQENYSVNEVSRRLGLSFWDVYKTMNKFSLKRRDFSLAGSISNKNKPQFRPKSFLSHQDELLKIAGYMLYWAEGTFQGNTVDFTNSNPEMIKLFLLFLRKICGVKEERLRIYLYAYDYQNIDALKKFWNETTQIPITQFTKPYIRKGNLNITKRKLLHGLVHIRYNDKKLLFLIQQWLDEYIAGQVPKWLKGTDCINNAAHDSNVMWKSG